MKKSKKYRKHIERLTAKFLKAVGAEEYQYYIQLDHDLAPGTTAHMSNIDTVYLHFILQISPQLREAYDKNMDYFVALIIMHEMCHLLVNPITCYFDSLYQQDSKFRQAEERQVQRIAIAILKQIDPKEYAID